MKKTSSKKTPVIIAASGGFQGYTIFNPNDFGGSSKPVVLSCANQLSLLHYLVKKVSSLFSNADELVETAVKIINEQWNTSKWPIGDCEYFVEVPDVHTSIVAFPATVKSLLDLLIQLLSTEKIVNAYPNGFHKNGADVGGAIINILQNNTVSSKKVQSQKTIELIKEHKRKWIDDIVSARDLLIHPTKGMSQVTFQLRIDGKNDELERAEIILPQFKGINLAEYFHDVLQELEKFSVEFLKIIRES